jgi:hypothetical protein
MEQSSKQPTKKHPMEIEYVVNGEVTKTVLALSVQEFLEEFAAMLGLPDDEPAGPFAQGAVFLFDEVDSAKPSDLR